MTLPEIVFIPCGGHLGRRGWFRSATPGVGLSAIDSPDGIEIVALNVLPAWRGQGLGTAVVRAVKARAGERRVTCIAVALEPEYQARLVAWYEREGVRCL